MNKHRKLLERARPYYDIILEAQDGHCALCERRPSATRKLDLDHDHKGMFIRGLLCHRCNRSLPHWVTSEWLRRAADYLEQPPIEIE